jgi:uncharacterized membrane protein
MPPYAWGEFDMRTRPQHVSLFWPDRGGNIGLSSALVLPLVVLSLGLGVDYGYLTLQKREMQSIADLTAIVAASNIHYAEDATRSHFKNNDLNLLIATEKGLVNIDGEIVKPDMDTTAGGVATLVKGRYVPDPALAVGQRFIPGATPADAVQVTIEKQGDLHLAAMFSDPPKLGAVGTAASTKTAAFSIGSRLASLDGGILNAVLGQILGTTLSLKVMDYRALADADIEIMPLTQALATRIDLTAATYEDVLLANITLPQLVSSMRSLPGLGASVESTLKLIETATAKNKATLTLANLLNLDPKRGLKLNAGSDWDMRISALEMIAAAAAVSNGENQVALNLGASLPGLTSVSLDLAIGEPPVETPAHRLGTPGSAVRTAQTRLAVNIGISGLSSLAGIDVNLPLYVEVAHAEGGLSDIRCYGGSHKNASVSIDAVPGVAEIAIGRVHPSVLSNFSKEARVEKARLVDARVLKIDAIAHVETKNMRAQRLTFSPAEIARQSMKSVSTRDILTSTTQTLLRNLDADIEVLFLSLGTPKLLQAALAETLGAVTPQVDTLLYNLLLIAGVRIGEADIRVTGVSCLQPVLVQ